MTRTVSPQEARTLIHGGGEVAFLDLREAGPFSMGHPLFAVPCPYSTLETRIGRLVPRAGAPVLLLDGGDGIAERGVTALGAMGYTDVAVIEGGAPGWEAAGHTLYKGVNVPCKLLGELVGETWEPKRIGPDALAVWQEEGRDVAFYDCRPRDEFIKMTVPGTTCLPNGEVAHRLPAAVKEGQPLLLTCAGRTRGLIGAASLRAVAPEIEVYALENGTQGWALSGRQLLRDNTPSAYPELTEAGRAKTRDRAVRFIEAERLNTTDAAGIRSMLAETGRTTYLIDVRSDEEAVKDPLVAFVHGLSVQVVQASDQWIGVRRSRVVLADDLGLRAAITAYWLRAMGFETYIARIDDKLRDLPRRMVPEARLPALPEISAAEVLAHARAGGVRLIDVRSSNAYRKGHLAGAVWSIRPEMGRAVDPSATLHAVIGDGSEATLLAASELLNAGARGVSVVIGGQKALVEAGAAIEATPCAPPELESSDVTWFAHGRHDGDLDASRTYLDWEIGLEHQLDAEERAEYAL